MGQPNGETEKKVMGLMKKIGWYVLTGILLLVIAILLYAGFDLYRPYFDGVQAWLTDNLQFISIWTNPVNWNWDKIWTFVTAFAAGSGLTEASRLFIQRIIKKGGKVVEEKVVEPVTEKLGLEEKPTETKVSTSEAKKTPVETSEPAKEPTPEEIEKVLEWARKQPKAK